MMSDRKNKKFKEKVQSISRVILMMQGGQSLGEISKIGRPLTFSVPKRVIHPFGYIPILTQLESMWYHTIGIITFCSGTIKAYRNKAERY